MIRIRGFIKSSSLCYPGGILPPQRDSAQTIAVRRFETPPGRQAQLDWGHLGTIDIDGVERKLWGFAFTLGYSRAMFVEAALSQPNTDSFVGGGGITRGGHYLLPKLR